eukprot:m.138535 g.138535  ORF g.138535 m.138535 type:complete len:444 (+) comp24039_c0_seq4:29-1360(+)
MWRPRLLSGAAIPRLTATCAVSHGPFVMLIGGRYKFDVQPGCVGFVFVFDTRESNWARYSVQPKTPSTQGHLCRWAVGACLLGKSQEFSEDWVPSTSQILVGGGFDSQCNYADLFVLTIDHENGRAELEDQPTIFKRPRAFASFVYDEDRNRVLSFGGQFCRGGPYEYNNEVQSYSLQTKKLSLIKTNNDVLGPTPRAQTFACLVKNNDYLLVFGGTNGNQVFNDVYLLDLATNNWSEIECTGPGPQYLSGFQQSPFRVFSARSAGAVTPVRGQDRFVIASPHLFGPKMNPCMFMCDLRAKKWSILPTLETCSLNRQFVQKLRDGEVARTTVFKESLENIVEQNPVPRPEHLFSQVCLALVPRNPGFAGLANLELLAIGGHPLRQFQRHASHYVPALPLRVRVPWCCERLLWLSRIKQSGLFRLLPPELIELILSFVNGQAVL